MSEGSLESEDEQSGPPTASEPSRRTAGKQPGGDGDRTGGWRTLTELPERQLEQTGSDPDPRFTFANERTFLAWNRTALALIAAGLAAAQFLHFNLHGLRLIVAVPLIVLGAVFAVSSYVHWLDTERAMRLRQPLRYSWMPRVLAATIALIALCGGILALVDRLVD
jgi:putative membrane protein